MKIEKFDPFYEGEIEEATPNVRYQKAGESNFYFWDFKKYLRVSAVLSQASGNGLVAWNGQQASLRAASYLVHSGLYVPSSESTADAQLEAFVDGEAIRKYDAQSWPSNVPRTLGLSPGQAWAIWEASQWTSNSIEGERYRDHKGRIGSVQHAASFARFMGTLPPGELLEAIMPICYDQIRGEEAMLARFEALGKSADDVALDLAHHAKPYVEHTLTWIDAYKPEPYALGVETVVIDPEGGCAGTRDLLAMFKKADWEKNGTSFPFDGSEAMVTVDYKNSNKLSGNVRFQLGKYASSPMIANFADYTEHTNPESAGLLALHVGPEGTAMRHWTRECIEPFTEVFDGLLIYSRGMRNLPRARRATKVAKATAKLGERPCPF